LTNTQNQAEDSLLFPEEITHFGVIMSSNPLDAYKEFDPKLIERHGTRMLQRPRSCKPAKRGVCLHYSYK
jgi:hypothetical protein